MKASSSLQSSLHVGRRLFHMLIRAVHGPVTVMASLVLLALCLGTAFFTTLANQPVEPYVPGYFLSGLTVTLLQLALSLAVAFLTFCIPGAIVLGLLSPSWRRPLSGFLEVAADLPALAGCGLLLAAGFSSLTTIALVTGVSLGVRSLVEGLKASRELPEAFFHTAQSLRLTRMQLFRHLHLPLVFPAVGRGLIEDMPDFWVRLLGSQMLLFLYRPQQFSGWGGEVLQALAAGKPWAFVALVLGASSLGILFHQLLIRPLHHLLKGYESALPANPYFFRSRIKLPGAVENSFFFSLGLFLALLGGVVGLCGYAYTVHAMAEGVWELSLLFCILTLPIFWATGLFWLCGGSWALQWKSVWCKTVRHALLFMALFPFVFFYPLLREAGPILLAPFLLLWLTLQGEMGGLVIKAAQNSRLREYFSQARKLQLPLLQEWLAIRLPLMLPAVMRGQQILSWGGWNAAYLVLIFFFVPRLIGRDLPPVTHGIFLLCLTALIFGYRSFLLFPASAWLGRKYRLDS
ncbi:ABC transporter permease family protein [Oecophyllibacter saccharovorans]|uniref:Uncharacterized protein n=1 Tax=Oecophyllibacter saccharovorans TaxID=2558360 RepID=A0A506UQM0_9PROT|nr:hypothetical protein [Oecophyllibacter saccharovorans]TPW35647.1 hypothetical protein E3202_01385 [Oecophyllibacter saccharovorans]